MRQHPERRKSNMAKEIIERKKTGKKIWAAWDCPYCGNTAISGKLRECPGCGRPRSTDTEYYKSGPKEYLSDEEAAAHQNPDWMCECCDSYNPDIAQTCLSCGAPRGASKDYFEIRKAAENKDNVMKNTSESVPDDIPARYKNDKPLKDSVKERCLSVIGIAVGIVAVMLAIVFFVRLMMPKDVTLLIDSKSWSRSIAVEEETRFQDEGWTLPSYARELDRQWKLKEKDVPVFDHYKTVDVEVTKSTEVWDHDEETLVYTDDGNGALDEEKVTVHKYRTEYYTDTEESQEAVYRYEDVYDWYYWYEWDEWVKTRSVDTSGMESEPYWGKVDLGSYEREGRRTEDYKVDATIQNKDNDKKTFSLSESDWESLNVGDVVTAKIYAFGDTLEIIAINGEAHEKQ